MKEIHQFLSDYLALEYKAHLDTFNRDLNASKHNEIYNDPLSSYWGANRVAINHNLEKISKYEPITDEDLTLWREQLKTRKILRITAFSNPTLGEKLAEKFGEVSTIYKCILNEHTTTANPDLTSSRAFFVIQTEGKYQIIYRERFIDGQWEPPHDGVFNHVVNYGNAIEQQDYFVPEDPASLTDFNKNKL